MDSGTLVREAPGLVDSCEGLLEPCETLDGNVEVVQGDLYVVGGWIFCERPLKAITILTEGLLLGVAQHGFPRPDVARALGKPQAEACGFRGLIHTTDLALGEHTLTVECVTEDGAPYRANGRSITLTVVRGSHEQPEFAKGYIDSIKIGDEIVYPGSLPVTFRPGAVAIVQGWILTSDAAAGTAAALLLNDKVIPALYGIERPDLVEHFGEPARYGGFVGKIDVDLAVTAGGHLTIGILQRGGTRFSGIEAQPIPIVKQRSSGAVA